MAKKYQAVSAGAEITQGTDALIYTVPQGRTAKLTFISLPAYQSFFKVKKNGSQVLVSGPIVGYLGLFFYRGSVTLTSSSFNYSDCTEGGIYFSEGDEVYISGDTAGTAYMCLMEEYEEA